ncbi:DNA polymerase III subunit delta [Roseospirillum parvum]|uniref:DNA-directed DNA polymerase n=1 Tax=Roseospirillum parvum TaxID=83401 RepID=A0A1G8DT68_9PROT|nr:DNA polymerase III subunit delta [Roseospirillum parvum]SDH60842.1 DNA polymerase III, delta subunit [Roseospirillum parvum]
MKLAAPAINGFLANPDPKIRLVLVYGPDRGLVVERLDALTRRVAGDRHDPFRVAELAASEITAEPARLFDEAAAQALTGGRRVVRVVEAGDSLGKRLDAFLDDPPGDALILIEGGDLSPRSSLRVLAEKHPLAAALPCYADEGRTLETVIRDTLAEHGLGIAPEALELLHGLLGGDRALTRAELEKLALLAADSPGGKVTTADVLASVGDSSALDVERLAFAIADGRLDDSQQALQRLFQQGQAPITVLRGVARHFQRLHLCAGRIGRGTPPDKAMASLKPPVFFKHQAAFRNQLRAWDERRAARALALLTETEAACKTTGNPAQTLTARLVLQLAASVGRRG